MDLVDTLDAVSSRESLQTFVYALREDLMQNPQDWENDSLDRFLAALAGWIGDMGGYFRNQGIDEPAEPNWNLVGQMLMAASTYE